MNDVIPQLSIDEITVLQIAAADQPLLDLGEHSRWHGPIQALTKRGLLEPGQMPMNFVITNAGRSAIHEEDKDNDRALADLLNKQILIKNRPEYREIQSLIEGAAGAFATAIELSIKLNGEHQSVAIDKWRNAMIDRVRAILDQKKIAS